MRDRRRYVDLCSMAAMQELQRLDANQALARATVHESEKDRAEAVAREAVERTLTFWSECFASRSLEPHLLAGLDVELRARDADHAAAVRELQVAQAETQAGRERYGLSLVQAARTAAAKRRARRRLMRRAEEAALRRLEDQITYRGAMA